MARIQGGWVCVTQSPSKPGLVQPQWQQTNVKCTKRGEIVWLAGTCLSPWHPHLSTWGRHPPGWWTVPSGGNTGVFRLTMWAFCTISKKLKTCTVHTTDTLYYTEHVVICTDSRHTLEGTKDDILYTVPSFTDSRACTLTTDCNSTVHDHHTTKLGQETCSFPTLLWRLNIIQILLYTGCLLFIVYRNSYTIDDTFYYILRYINKTQINCSWT